MVLINIAADYVLAFGKVSTLTTTILIMNMF